MKKLVIIGGGFAGSKVARTLEKNFDTTLIDTKDYFEFTPGILRAIIEPEHLSKLQIFHKNYLKSSKIVIGEVKTISSREVFIGKKRIEYDYLVITSGSNYNLPFKEHTIIASRSDHLKNSHFHLAKSEKILILGGGPVGVELAAEIITKYPGKKLAILDSNKELMARNNKKTQEYAKKFLTKKGVKFFFGEKVSDIRKNGIITESGKRIEFDMVFLCTGIKPNSEFIFNSFNLKIGDELANKHLQLIGKNNIFIAGDVAGIKEEKLAQNAERQAMIVIKNILALEKELKLEEYQTKKVPMVISLGKWKGIFEYKKFVLGGIIPGILKNLIEWREMMKLRIH